jgi:CRISPR system Cascade subunit CasE
MYLSRLLLDPRSRQLRKELANRYELHRTLLSPYPEMTREEIGLLYRIEQPDQDQMHPIQILVQTQMVPLWEKIDQSRLPIQEAVTKVYQPTPRQGEKYHFRLVGNPTIRRREGDFSGKRVELRLMEEQYHWIEQKSARCGFSVLSLEISDLGKIISNKLDGQKRQVITQQAVLFQGSLEVINSALFLNAISKGIGSGKGFGFGLLSIAR